MMDKGLAELMLVAECQGLGNLENKFVVIVLIIFNEDEDFSNCEIKF